MSNILILQAFGRIRRKVNLLATQELKPFDIGPKQAILIGYVYKQGDCSPAELARATLTDPAAVARATDALVEEGWLQRKPHPTDRRQWILSLAPKQMKKYKEIQKIYEKISDSLVSTLTEKETRALLSLLIKIENSLKDGDLTNADTEEC